MWRPRLTPRACLLKLSGLPRAGHPARGAVLAAARSAPVFLSGDFKPVEAVGAQKHEMDHHRQQEQEHALRHEHAARIEDQPDLVEFSHLSFPPQNHGNQMKVAICATTATSVNSQRPLIYTECSSWACSSVRPVKDRSDLSAMNFPPERYADAANPAAGCLWGLHGPSGFCPPPQGQAGRVSDQTEKIKGVIRSASHQARARGPRKFRLRYRTTSRAQRRLANGNETKKINVK